VARMFPLLWGTERLKAEQFPRQEPDTLYNATTPPSETHLQ
jgi:hypothetical protein